MGRPVFLAAAIGVTAAAVMLTAATEQDQQNDDPAQIATAEAVVTKVTHKTYLRKLDAAVCRSSHVMTQEEKCAVDPPPMPQIHNSVVAHLDLLLHHWNSTGKMIIFLHFPGQFLQLGVLHRLGSADSLLIFHDAKASLKITPSRGSASVMTTSIIVSLIYTFRFHRKHINGFKVA